MAAINYEMARAAAEKLIQAGQAKGLTREALISQIIAQTRAAGEAPQGAIASVVAQPEPVVLSPGKPAVPGVPFIAPKSVAPAPAPPPVEAAPMPEPAPRPAAAAPRPSRYRPMLEAAKQELGAMQSAIAANKQPASEVDKAKLVSQSGLVRELEQRAMAEEGAAAPEEMLAALAKREERLGRREELLQESKARSPWEALLAGGAAMAQGRRGENFGEALSRGLQAGLQDYGRSRRENIAGVEEIGEARDETALKRYELGEKAREGASKLIDTQSAIEQRSLTLRNNLLKIGVDEATANATVQTALANAKKAAFEAETAPRVLEAGLALTAAQTRKANERDKPEVDVEKRTNRALLNNSVGDFKEAEAEYKAALADAGGDPKAIADPKVVSNYRAKYARALQDSTAFFNRHGETPYPFGGAAMGRKAAAKPATASADPLGIRR